MAKRFDLSTIPENPDLSFEESLWNQGLIHIAGIDEAGRGCLAGPVTAAAVTLPHLGNDAGLFSNVRDSKQITAREREKQRTIIEGNSLDWGVGFASNLEIDRYGIVPSTRLAVSRALENLKIQPQHLLVDYIVLPDIAVPQTRLVKGDARSLSIAAASILAKTHRDAFMAELSGKYPGYDLENNKGYGTAAHREAIRKLGPSPFHRMSFAPLRTD